MKQARTSIIPYCSTFQYELDQVVAVLVNRVLAQASYSSDLLPGAGHFLRKEEWRNNVA